MEDSSDESLLGDFPAALLSRSMMETAVALLASFDSKEKQDDEKPVDDDGYHALSWKQDPKENFSDYKIIVVTSTNDDDGSEQTKEYNVHKSVLAVGPRKSIYFERLLKGNEFQESATQTSRITLHKVAAETFPNLLDYMYSNDVDGSKKIFKTIHAVALHHLGQYFDIRQLRLDVKKFWEQDLCPSNCHIYYEQASILHQSDILKAVEELCISKSEDVSHNKEIFKVTEPPYWLGVLKKKKLPGNESWGGEFLVLSLCDVRLKDIDQNLFKELTDKNNLTTFKGDSAFSFLRFEKQMINSIQNEATDLQKRCIDVLCKKLVSQKGSCCALQTRILGVLKECNAKLVEIFLLQVIDCQRSNYKKLKKSNEAKYEALQQEHEKLKSDYQEATKRKRKRNTNNS